MSILEHAEREMQRAWPEAEKNARYGQGQCARAAESVQ